MMSRLLYAKPISYVYVHILYNIFFSIICIIGVAFAFTFHVCLGTVICSFILILFIVYSVNNHCVVLYKCTKIKIYMYI